MTTVPKVIYWCTACRVSLFRLQRMIPIRFKKA